MLRLFVFAYHKDLAGVHFNSKKLMWQVIAPMVRPDRQCRACLLTSRIDHATLMCYYAPPFWQSSFLLLIDQH